MIYLKQVKKCIRKVRYKSFKTTLTMRFNHETHELVCYFKN